MPWVNFELNGYPDRDSVPEYRILPAQVLVNASNGAYRIISHHIPMGHLEDKDREVIETIRMDRSLAVLEEVTEKDSGGLQRHIPMELYGLLGKGLDNGYQIESAWSKIDRTSVLQMLTQVRSRLLDFVLEMNEQFPSELNKDQVKERISSVDTENLFNNAIFGDNTTILVGSSNSQNVSNVSIKGDFGALAEILEKNGVSESDISSLKDAIEQDSSRANSESKEFGPAVKSWLQMMLSKAVEASWNVELGVASSLLATALNN